MTEYFAWTFIILGMIVGVLTLALVILNIGRDQ